MEYVPGVLREEPQIGSSGSEIQFKYAYVYLRRLDNKFEMCHCSYNKLNLNKFLKLKAGDSVVLGITERSFLRGSVNVYELSSKRLGSILELTDFNYCSRNSWRRGWQFVIALLSIVVLRILYKLIK